MKIRRISIVLITLIITVVAGKDGKAGVTGDRENNSGDRCIDKTNSLSISNSANAATPPRLHVEGNKIKDPNGTTIVPRGIAMVDLGATELWYGGATAAIDRVTNTNDPNGNSPGWYPKIIRIPVCPHNSALFPYSPLTFDPNDVNSSNNETFYNLLRNVVDYCGSKGLYAVIDWHLMANTYDEVNDTNVFWSYIAPKFADDTHVLFELFNEPCNTGLASEAADWNSVRTDMQTWIDTIRASAPHNLILVGTPQYDQILAPVVNNPVADENVVYVSHLYPIHWLGEYTGGNNSYYLNHITTCAAQYPVIVTEWGFWDVPQGEPNFFRGTITNYGQPLKDFLESYGIGNTAWCLSNGAWTSPMFDPNWQLRCGEKEMGCFTKDWLFEKNATPMIELNVANCTVTAGKTQGQDINDIKNIKDAFTASGTFAHFNPYFNYAGSFDINIISLKNTDPNIIYSQVIPFSASQVMKGKYAYTHKITKTDPKGVITSLKFDFNKNTFAIKAKNINLTGLGAPLKLDIKIHPYTLAGAANETIINGNESIPTRLMRRYQDTLAISKAKAKHNTNKASTDSLSVKGEIAVADMNLNSSEPNLAKKQIVFSWGEANGTPQTFTIDPNNFKAFSKGHVYNCSKVHPSESSAEPNALVSAAIDLDKCVFTLSISKADNLFAGPTTTAATFGISFDTATEGTAFNQTADVNVITGKPY